MSNLSSDLTVDEKTNNKNSKQRRSHLTLISIAILSIFFAAFITLILCFFTGSLAPATDTVITFWISFLVGLGGAGVYLTLLLIVEGHLKILKNNIVADLGVMSFLFLLSGGFVAAVTQVSAGILAAGGVQAVFMVGFGWLGALSGVAGVKARAELNLENKDLAEEAYQAETKLESSVEGLKKDRNKLINIIEEGKNRILELNEEIERLKGKRKDEQR
jgi:hypothetical protein